MKHRFRKLVKRLRRRRRLDKPPSYSECCLDQAPTFAEAVAVLEKLEKVPVLEAVESHDLESSDKKPVEVAVSPRRTDKKERLLFQLQLPEIVQPQKPRAPPRGIALETDFFPVYESEACVCALADSLRILQGGVCMALIFCAAGPFFFSLAILAGLVLRASYLEASRACGYHLWK